MVYWGTSGQKITERYIFDVFSVMELKDSGELLYGFDIRNQIKYPTRLELIEAIQYHYSVIRKYAVTTGRSLYSAGWLLDIARCLYTLETGKIIAKTAAGRWAIEKHIVPNVNVMQTTLEIREYPSRYKNDEDVLKWLETLGPDIQRFADVLEEKLCLESIQS